MKTFLKSFIGLSNITKIYLYLKFLYYYVFIKIIKKNTQVLDKLNKKKSILIFLPELGIRFYLLIHVFIGLVFRSLGYEVIFARCFNKLDSCKFLEHEHLNSNSNKALKYANCINCYLSSETILKFFNFKLINLLDSYLLDNLKNKLNKIDIKSILKYKYKNINIGKLSCYDFFINHKINSIKKIDINKTKLLRNYLLNSVSVIFYISRLIKKFKFNHVVTMDEYSSDLSLRLFLKKKKIDYFRSSIAYHKNGDPRFIGLTRTQSIVEENILKNSKWKNWKNIPLSKKVIDEIYSDLLIKIYGTGTHNYSFKKQGNSSEILENLNIHKHKKILVLFSSSEDEHEALKINYEILKLKNNYKDIYKNNFEWIEDTIDFVENSNDYYLFVKLHPRIGKTFRDNTQSQIYESYKKKFFSKSFKNCTVIKPDQKISSYDLADICDVAIIGWGTIGLEMSRLCIPSIVVMRSFLNNTPDLKLLTYANSRKNYFKLIQDRANYIPTTKDIIEILRWYNLINLSNSIFIRNFNEFYLDYKNFKIKKNEEFDKIDKILNNKRIELIDLNLEKIRSYNKNCNYNVEKLSIFNNLGKFTKVLLNKKSNKTKLFNRLLNVKNNFLLN